MPGEPVADPLEGTNISHPTKAPGPGLETSALSKNTQVTHLSQSLKNGYQTGTNRALKKCKVGLTASGTCCLQGGAEEGEP